MHMTVSMKHILTALALAAAFLAGPVLANDLLLHDPPVQGALVRGTVTPGSEIRLGDTPVRVAGTGAFVFGLPYNAPSEVQLSVTYPDGDEEVKTLSVRPQQYNIERIDGLPPSTVTIPEEERRRRARERAMVGEARSGFRESLHWRGRFVLPAEGRVSGVYGSQRILNGEPRTPHFGLDIAAPVGTPIHAPAAGVVTLAHADFLLEGGIVIIDHGFSVTSTLFHMSQVDVEEGQRVEQGDKIGEIGARGRASGPHVDWRVNWGGVRVDPGLLVNVTKVE